jgi:hypothetical protein
VLYLHDSCSEASPKAISGRTSYLRVRLAFHPYPHLILWFFNTNRFGPPFRVTGTSPWTWVDHPVSGRRLRTHAPYSDSLSLRLRLLTLTSHATVTRRFILQKARRHSLKELRLIVSTRFQVLFHSPPGVLFTFPSRYWFTIGRQGVFSLGRWSSLLPTGFHVSRGTQDPSRRATDFGYRAITFYSGSFQNHFTYPSPFSLRVRRPTTPTDDVCRFGLFPFRSPLLWESRLLSSPQGTKMFQFPWSASCHPMDSDGGTSSSSWWVAPFGNPRINACLRLPEAYRCSPRPSSAPGAKASTVCP